MPSRVYESNNNRSNVRKSCTCSSHITSPTFSRMRSIYFHLYSSQILYQAISRGMTNCNRYRSFINWNPSLPSFLRYRGRRTKLSHVNVLLRSRATCSSITACIVRRICPSPFAHVTLRSKTFGSFHELRKSLYGTVDWKKIINLRLLLNKRNRRA
jgi:hypothetical protein